MNHSTPKSEADFEEWSGSSRQSWRDAFSAGAVVPAPDEIRPQEKRARRSIVRRGFGIVLIVAGSFVIVSTLWSIVYGLLPPPTTALMTSERFRLGDISYEWRAIEEIPQHVKLAVVAAEDARFCAHRGVDLEAIETALSEAREGRRLRGASTISQQTAKNAFLWTERSWFRKGLELWFTGLIETWWSKQRVLEIYLNVVEFRPGVFGVEAAAKDAFGVSAERLAPRQAALLAAALPNPRERDAAAPSEFLSQRAAQIMSGAETLAVSGAAACVEGR